MERATWTVNHEPEACVLVVRGEIDMDNAGAFGAAGLALAEGATGPRRLVVDLSAVRFMDSSGLRALVRIQRQASVVMVLREPTPIVGRLLEVALPGVFTIE